MRKVNFDLEIAQEMNSWRGFNKTLSDLRTDDFDRKPEVFLKNIKFLMKHRGMPKATIAKEANVPQEWLRQVSRRGLVQNRGGSKTSLDRLRRFFLLDSVDEFWSDHLIDSIKETARREAQMQPFLRSKDWTCCWKLFTLLQAGDYDFLRGLIDRLYGQETADGCRSSRDSHNEEDKASAEDLAEHRRSRSS